MPHRTIAIGDLHGCSAALDALIDAIAPGPEDVVLTLGDYINRGPDSRVVLDTCCYGGGWLTAMDVDTGKVGQANRAGQFARSDRSSGLSATVRCWFDEMSSR